MTQPNATPELREAIRQIFEKRLDEAVKFINPKYTYHGSYQAAIDEILALFQAREQHPSTSRGYMMGFKAGQQQLLTELLGELPEKVGYFVETEPELSVSQQKIFGDGYNQAINQVVSIIERYREGLHEV